MRPETITEDIRRTLALAKAEQHTLATRNTLLDALDTGRDCQAPLERAIAARAAQGEEKAAWQRIPNARKEQARKLIATAEELGRNAARALGGAYSGETRYWVNWGEQACASTATGQGTSYSRSCSYKKIDADHIVTLDSAGVPLLVQQSRLQQLSITDGLHLIALYPDNSAVWVKSKGRSSQHGSPIVSEQGWVIGNDTVCFHSVKSKDHAQKGFEKKWQAHMAELKALRKSNKDNRRARLVVRLCHTVKATLADAKERGYCEPGIREFQTRYGIGDTATLPELVHSGNPAAVSLALSIARKVKRSTA